MKFWLNNYIFSWFPRLNRQVWILAMGRFLSEIGGGFTLFYIPIFFVNHVGLSPTEVGFGIGCGAISGVLGRISGGSLSDWKLWGRRRTLLLSAVISAMASLLLAMANNFPAFVIANLLMGIGIGLYWPATEAVVIDLTTAENRQDAFALTRLADNIGLGLGIILAGLLINISGAYRALFIIDAISFIIFFAVIYVNISESYHFIEHSPTPVNGWILALSDRTLLVYVIVNIIFTTYMAQLESTIPLYFKNFVSLRSTPPGFSEITISGLFTENLVLAIVCQFPVIRMLKNFSHAHSLMISALIWGIGFICIGLTGVVTSYQIVWALLGMGIMAIAIVSYTPSASALVAEIAPESLRGVYLAINSLCWALGYFIGPILGGFALTKPGLINYFWIGLILSIIIPILILRYLNQMLVKKL